MLFNESVKNSEKKSPKIGRVRASGLRAWVRAWVRACVRACVRAVKAALDPCSLINSLAIYFDGVSCCKCLILRILNTDSFKTYQG